MKCVNYSRQSCALVACFCPRGDKATVAQLASNCLTCNHTAAPGLHFTHTIKSYNATNLSASPAQGLLQSPQLSQGEGELTLWTSDQVITAPYRDQQTYTCQESLHIFQFTSHVCCYCERKLEKPVKTHAHRENSTGPGIKPKTFLKQNTLKYEGHI